MLKRPTAVNLENDSKTTRKKDENNTKKKGNQNEEKSREAAMLYWGRGRLARGKGGAVSRPHQRVAKKQRCNALLGTQASPPAKIPITSIASITSIPSIPPKTTKNTSFPPKNAFFFKIICTYQKKAVPLHRFPK